MTSDQKNKNTPKDAWCKHDQKYHEMSNVFLQDMPGSSDSFLVSNVAALTECQKAENQASSAKIKILHNICP